MRASTRGLPGFLFALLCWGVAVSAQEKKEPSRRHSPAVTEPSDSTSRPLPKIDLPEFVITGNEVIDFKEFSKTGVDQSLSLKDESPQAGLNREPVTADLGGSWKEKAAFSAPAGGLNGRFSAGYGSFGTPSFDGWFGMNSSSSNVLLRAGFVSSDGHVRNADYRDGFSELNGAWRLPQTSPIMPGAAMEGNLGVVGKSYRFYGSTVPLRERTVSGFNLGLGISSTLFDGFDEHAAVALRTTSVDDSADAKERELSADLHVAGKVEGLDVQGSFGIIWNFFSAPSAMYDPFLLQGQFSTRYTLAQNVELSGGLSLFAFRGSDTRTSGRIYPSLGVSWFAASGIRLFADIGPTIERGRLSDLLERNPYLRTDIGVRPTEHTMRFSVGADGDVAPGFRARLAVTYDRMRDYPLFSDPAFAGTWDIEYRGMTTFLSLDGSLYADLSDNDHAGLNFTVRSTRNTDTEAVPYVPRVHLSGLYSHRFPIDLTLRSSLQVLGSTPVDVNSSRYIPAYAVVSLDAEYSVVHNVELTMKLDNLLDSEQRRFEGYLGYPRSVRLGLRYSW